MMTTAHYQTPLGVLDVTLDDDRIIAVNTKHLYPGSGRASRTVSYDSRYRGVRKQLGEQLKRYFDAPHVSFDVPLQQQGTPYQQRVWQALQRIPPGQTLTYGQLANRLHTSPRAIGNACRQNPLPLLIPCHRVVAANGLGGFSGKTTGVRVALKRWLLQHEGVAV
ncbi:MAG: methylated-DNA--[protein]-cysteine S-methyltransferase [Thiohalomonadales bacterium]|nr:methylated-DNA--[protein]-cysteine S-methyltransferase [Thiohalomonadales bacterium]